MPHRTEVQKLADANGGYWGPGHKEFTPENWKYEVANDDTRTGYWEWVDAQINGD